ncbi:BTAD domain-containing putative transcriptional regulator [Actinoplanes couchii]|uniref:SARP family transcriptional regulator n=1 Tax=Actinoplanes couchii TaxID=403638 RepID=A0ABQ3X3F5_9ACTN|nr:BTAD domain-containing putative transcriptional regulator [Actinoplanes couchii]MDR6322801.1 putative ATPase/DNA-binding SARP family transcriptional activator [Actinoplanes couchii]GID53041.1 SARP family transcriptional regulator [Actinoplanes couchii]
MEIGVLGPVLVRGKPVVGARLRTLVILLALDAGREVSADRLVDGIWGERRAANSLQALISRLRRTGLTVEATRTGYRLVVAPEQVDAHRFAEHPEEHLHLWRGELDFPAAAEPEAVLLREKRLRAQRATLAGNVPELEALVTAHPLDEPLAALLIRALDDDGNRARALEVFDTVRRRLRGQLGVDPSPELSGLHRELLADRRGNLPVEVSSFIGDPGALDDLLRAHRLVTLTGPGGSGKTRLSVEAGARLPGEVWLVELASVRDPAELAPTILTILGLRVHGRPLDRLREALTGREMLLILDNCEHVIEAAAELAGVLLRAAPGLRMLATSREPLGITGERLFPVEPLALPDAGADPESAARAPAVRLLLERASGFELTEHNTPAVVRVCRALDGIPLAIELAAARLRTLPPAVLADRLADRFRLLTGGSRTALPRHRTLRAVVDWSWDLLSDAERRSWRRFAALPGGADVTTAEQVCAADPDLLGALVDKSLLNLGADGRYRMLETIREYGLERLAEAGEVASMRRSLLDHLTALAVEAEPHLRRAEQLEWLDRLSREQDNLHASAQDAITAGDRAGAVLLVAHLGWYFWLTGRRTEGTALCVAAIGLDGPADRAALAMVHAFAALNGVEGLLPFDEVKRYFLEARRLAEGREHRHPALRLLDPLATISTQPMAAGYGGAEALFDDQDPWLRAVSRMLIGQLRVNLGEAPEAAEADLRAGLDGFRLIGERWGIGFTLSSLADMAAARGDFGPALVWQREALTLLEEVGIREDLPQLAVKMAHQMWLDGSHEEAHRMLKRAREMAREVGLPEVMASVHHCHAVIALAEGRLDEAREHNVRAVHLIEHSTFAPQFRSMAHSTAALIEGAAGDLVSARREHRTAIRIAMDSQDSPVIAQVLAGIGDLALREGDPERAAFLLGAADAVRGSRDRTVEQAEVTRAGAHAALGDAGFDEAYRKGGGISVVDVIEVAGLEPLSSDLLDSGLGLGSLKESNSAAERPHRERTENDQEAGGPDQ